MDTEKERKSRNALLTVLLESLEQEKCWIAKHPGQTCRIDCPFYISGDYDDVCAINIVQENLD